MLGSVHAMRVNTANILFLIFRGTVGTEERLVVQERLIPSPELDTIRATLVALVVRRGFPI